MEDMMAFREVLFDCSCTEGAEVVVVLRGFLACGVWSYGRNASDVSRFDLDNNSFN
jgi:hypothetical protein